MKYFGLFLIAACSLVLPSDSSAQINQTFIQKQINHLIQENGQIVFTAFYAVPETRGDFVNVMGTGQWNSFMPSHLYEQPDSAQKREIRESVEHRLTAISEQNQKRVLFHLSNWLNAYKALAVAQQITTTEQLLSAIYSNPQSRKYFLPFLAKRNLHPGDMSASEVASSLSSGEIANILYHVLDNLSKSDTKTRLSYLDFIYHYLLNDYKNW